MTVAELMRLLAACPQDAIIGSTVYSEAGELVDFTALAGIDGGDVLLTVDNVETKIAELVDDNTGMDGRVYLDLQFERVDDMLPLLNVDYSGRT